VLSALNLFSDGVFERHFASGLMQTGQSHGGPGDVPPARGEVPAHACSMEFTKVFGHEDRDFAADELLGRVSENFFDGGVNKKNAAALINGDDNVGRISATMRNKSPFSACVESALDLPRRHGPFFRSFAMSLFPCGTAKPTILVCSE